MSRSAIPFALSIATGLLMGCQQMGNPIDQSPTYAPGGVAALGAVHSTHEGAINAMGLYDVTVDPGSLSASVSLVESRSGQKNGDIYLLPIDGFLKPDSFRIRAVRQMPTVGVIGSRTPRLELFWTLEHPFASSASIPRADLGFTGIACFLFDVPTATGHSYFTGDVDVILNESLMLKPDGYFKPGALLDLTGYTANTFPYQLLVNDWGNGNRTNSVTGEPIYNGLVSTGNFLPDGWQTGTTETWTGFDVLHQGQTAERVLSLDLAAIESAGSVNFRVAIFDKYVDPKSATPGSLHRLPADPPDLLGHFGYRYPHGCWDVSHVAFDYETQGLVTDKPSETTVHFRVRDWDARATVSAESDLSLEPDPAKVLVSSAGMPSLRACVPAAMGGPAAFVPFGSTPTDDDSHLYQRNGDVEADSGQPRDELYYRRTISSPAGVPASAGNRIWGVLEVADIEITIPDYQKVLDGNLQPLTANLPGNVTYQVFALEVQPRSTLTGWAASGEGAGNNWASAVTYDSLGNVYFGGSFSGSINLGGTTYTSAGSTDCFVAKYSLTGTFEWAETWGGTGADEVTSLLISDDDLFSLKVGGTFSGTVNFDPPAGSPRTAAAIDMFVLQLLSTNGSFATVRTYGSPGVDALTCLADNGNRATGDYFIAGYINGPVNFGGGHTLTAANPLEGFVAGMDRITNNAKSAYVLASGDYSTVSHMSLFENGEVGIAGVFVDSLTGPWGAEPGSGDEDIYLARLAMSTTPGASEMNWVYTSNLEGTESVGGLHAFSSGPSAHLLMARNYTYPDPVADGYSVDLLLLNLEPLSGRASEILHSLGIQRANGLAVRPGSTPDDLTFYITGYKTRPTNSLSFYFFGEPTLLGLPSGTESKDGFVWALSSDGTDNVFRTKWAREFGGDQGEEGLAIAAGPAAFGVEALAIGGSYQSISDFAPGPALSTLPVAGGTEAFVTQWPADGVW